MQEELDSEMLRLKEEFGGLVDNDTLRRLVESRGVYMSEKKISEFGDKEEVSATGKVTRIFDTKIFNKRTGGEGKVRNIGVEDDSGNCRITLWDEDVNLVETMGIEVGDELKLTSCYVKQTDYGTDVSKGRVGTIEKL